MADYYPVLARAISVLANDTAQTRQKLYEYARSFLNKYLDRSNPQILNVDRLSERIAFEAAVLKLETKSRFTHNTLSDRLAVLRRLHQYTSISHNHEFESVPDIASRLRESVNSSDALASTDRTCVAALHESAFDPKRISDPF
jgi:hypothetical protein